MQRPFDHISRDIALMLVVMAVALAGVLRVFVGLVG